MIKLSNSSKIFIFCPYNVVTGGAELLHQLVHVLNENNRNAYIIYYNARQNSDIAVPIPYKKYNIRIAYNIDDQIDNVVVLFEAIFDKAISIKSCQLIFWWLSVDNFFLFSRGYLSFLDYYRWNVTSGIQETFLRIHQTLHNPSKILKKKIRLNDLSCKNALNCYQSEYAQHFLISNKFKEILPLSDFINTDFVLQEELGLREDKILYNPKKGFKFTKKLIQNTPHLKWVPLENMTVDELKKEFQTSKLYVDFGYHPGKDRIPREAALNGCCVITNRCGSANFFEDVAIYNQYKIDEKRTSMIKIIRKIEETLVNYSNCISDFNFYKDRILNEEILFEKQVKDIFNIQ